MARNAKFVLVLVALMAASAVSAQGKSGKGKKPVQDPIQDPVPTSSWMSPEVNDAWNQGYRGQGVTITVVDDFSSTSAFSGNLNGTTQTLRHGEWTFKEASMVAPSATMRSQDYMSGTTVPLSTGLNVINLSYGMVGPAGYSTIGWSAQESSIISYARDGRAVISKAAGNDGGGTVVGQANSSGRVDYLNRDLIGSPSAIFVGALSSNGTVTSKASIASYSTIAGSDPTVQRQFLVVGVEGSKTGLYGTSFAAPIVSGYAAILGSKFTAATPVQITNQLLNTARQDTILNYSATVHGRGEASITRALAPVSIQ